jgi:hypothetical protein
VNVMFWMPRAKCWLLFPEWCMVLER